MTSQPDVQGLDDVVTLEGEDGKSYNCQVLHMFALDDQKYALLLNLGESNFDPEEEGEGSIVILRVSQKGEQAIFQTIESQEEFDRVVAHVEEMVGEEEE